MSAPGLAWQGCLYKTGVKLELLTDYDMLLMVEKGIKGGICQATYRYAQGNNKYMNNFDKKNWLVIYRIFRCKQFGNVSKITSKWFWMGGKPI